MPSKTIKKHTDPKLLNSSVWNLVDNVYLGDFSVSLLILNVRK